MFEIVHEAPCENSQLILTLEVFLDVTGLYHEVKALKGVKNVHNIVERIFFKVALRHFPCETDKWLKINICELEQIVELEDLVHQEL